MKRQHFTLEEHNELGLKLSLIQEQLVHMMADVCEAYGPVAKVAKGAHRAAESISKLRCGLDSEIHSERSELILEYGHALCRFYHGRIEEAEVNKSVHA